MKTWNAKQLSDDQKRLIVMYILTSGMPLKEVCPKFNISEGTYYQWRNKLFIDGKLHLQKQNRRNQGKTWTWYNKKKREENEPRSV